MQPCYGPKRNQVRTLWNRRNASFVPLIWLKFWADSDLSNSWCAVVAIAGSSCHLVEQRLRLFEVGCGEALGEPAVDWGEQVASFGASAFVAPQPGEAHGGAQLPEFGLLLSGDTERLAIQFLGGLGIPLSQQHPAFPSVELRLEPALSCPFNDLQSLTQLGHGLFNLF